MACELRLLSQLGQCRVQGCTCGVVHLSVGAVSIRLSAKDATELTQALVSASKEFQDQEQTVSAAEIPGRDSEGSGGTPGGGTQIH